MAGGAAAAENRPGMSPAFCQLAMPSVQTSVSARDRARGDELAELSLRIGTLLLALGGEKPGSV